MAHKRYESENSKKKKMFKIFKSFKGLIILLTKEVIMEENIKLNTTIKQKQKNVCEKCFAH